MSHIIYIPHIYVETSHMGGIICVSGDVVKKELSLQVGVLSGSLPMENIIDSPQ